MADRTAVTPMPVYEFGRKVPYSGWSTARLEAALAAMEARRGHSSRWDFGIIGQAGKMRNELERRRREASL